MTRRIRSSLVTALFACGVAVHQPLAEAQDGTIRERLKERLSERQQRRALAGATPTAAAAITGPGDYRYTLEHGGLTRMYRVHVPAAYDPARPVSLLVALHGGGGSMDHQANDRYYGLIGKSDREGFVVVFPNGHSRFGSGKLATWNAGNCCGGARDQNADDVGFIRALLAHLNRKIKIDPERIFAAGMSNGGMMAYRLACEMPEVFKAIAAVAGTDNTRSCKPGQPVSILHIHARNDTHVLFGGGAGPDGPRRAAVTDYTSVADTVARWVGLNGCGANPRRILERAGAYCEVYSSCRGGAEVQLCVTDSGGHSWPGGHKARGDEPPSQAISANDVMWDFFKQQ